MKFRYFIKNYINRLEVLEANAKLQYSQIYEQLMNDLAKSYKYDDSFLNNVTFEEITMETHLSFVSSLISLQS